MHKEITCYDFAIMNPKLTIKQLNQVYNAKEIVIMNKKPIISLCSRCNKAGIMHVTLFIHGDEYLCNDCHIKLHKRRDVMLEGLMGE